MVEVKERPKTRGDHSGGAHAIRKVGVIGAGQMGNGIAHVCALAGLHVLLNDLDTERIAEGLATISGPAVFGISGAGPTVPGALTSLPAGVMPAFTGDVTNSAGSLATTVGQINGNPLGSTTPTSGNLLVANGTQWVTEAMSGDATLAASGAVTIGA